MSVQYTIVSTQFGVAVPVTYTIERANVSPLLLYYLITPPANFAINGDGSIIAPDQLIYTPRPVAGRTLIAGPLLQGYEQMTWIYTTMQPAEFTHLLSFYDPTNPVVTLTYLDKTGTWVQRRAYMHPPTYGTRETVAVNGVSLVFTGLWS